MYFFFLGREYVPVILRLNDTFPTKVVKWRMDRLAFEMCQRNLGFFGESVQHGRAKNMS